MKSREATSDLMTPWPHLVRGKVSGLTTTRTATTKITTTRITKTSYNDELYDDENYDGEVYDDEIDGQSHMRSARIS